MLEKDRQIFWNLEDDQAAALTIYGEGRGEKREDKEDIMSVILTRVDHRDWDGKTIKEVCFKQSQFSCYLSPDPNYPKLLDIAKAWRDNYLFNPVLRECMEIAQSMIKGLIPRTVHATQYYNPSVVNPAWKDSMVFVKHGRHHDFYIDKGMA
jgi:spore germination cell wall hydrolase CwlJ-like protein